MGKILDDAPDPQIRKLGERLRWLKEHDPAELKRIFTKMTPEEVEEILYNEDIWLRDSQRLRLDEKGLRFIQLLTGKFCPI